MIISESNRDRRDNMTTTVNDLPDEVLLQIFRLYSKRSHATTNEIVGDVSIPTPMSPCMKVCSRWACILYSVRQPRPMEIEDAVKNWAYNGCTGLVIQFCQPENAISVALIAADRDHWETAKWLLVTYYPDFITNSCVNKITGRFCKAGNLEAVSWLHDQGYRNKHHITTAAENGHLKLVKYLYQFEHPKDDKILLHAIRSGSLELVQWLVTNKRPELGSGKFVRKAAACNQFELMQWLYYQGDTNLAPYCFSSAIMYNNMPMVRWLEGLDCSMDASAFQYAVRISSMDDSFLMWLHEIGCPWDIRACVEAFRLRKYDVLRWLVDEGCPWRYDGVVPDKHATAMTRWVESDLLGLL